MRGRIAVFTLLAVLVSSALASAQTAAPRSESSKRAFMRQTGFPNGRPGYVVDHIVPLACGGPDTPGNMQWQTIDAAKAKDRVERLDCGVYQRAVPAGALAQVQSKPKPKPANEDVTVYVTRTGKKYHKAGCGSLRKSAIPMTLKDAVAAGYEPCKNCKPPVLKQP